MAKKKRHERFNEAFTMFNTSSRQIEIIKDELENWKFGIEGTNLENTNTYSELEDAVENLDKACESMNKALEYLDEVEIPGAIGKPK